MPYIGQEIRTKFDGLIDELSSAIVAEAVDGGDETHAAAYLNYCTTRLILSVFRVLFTTFKYWHLALISGILTNVKDEIYRRVGGPFEDEKIRKNGDVPEYEEVEA